MSSGNIIRTPSFLWFGFNVLCIDKITFYTSKICPYAQRAAIALKEVGAEYERVEIDLFNKPSWYKDINPDQKVPALNTEGQNVAESLVIIEYINDRFPEKK
jgi:glutathione S-transferase